MDPRGCGSPRANLAVRSSAGIEVGEVRSELLRDDLLVGWPWRLLVDLRAPAEPGDHVRSQIQRAIAGQQHAPDHGLKRGWALPATSEVRNACGCRVGLLGADAAVLYEEVCRVPGCEHAPVGLLYKAALIDRHKPVRSRRESRDRRARDPGQGHNPIDIQPRLAEDHHVWRWHSGHHASVEIGGAW